MQETRVLFLGWEDLLKKGMTTHSGILAWRIPWREQHGWLQSTGCKESDTIERLTPGASQVALVVKNMPAKAGDLKTLVQFLGWEDPLAAQPCLTLWDPVDCSPPGFSVHGIFQARILEWVAIFFCRGSSWPRDQTHISCVSCIGRQIFFFTTEPPGKPIFYIHMVYVHMSVYIYKAIYLYAFVYTYLST